MIFRICIALLAFVLVSCSNIEPNEKSFDYDACLPEEFSKDLELLTKSFDEFVNRNFEGDKSKYISFIIERNFPEKSQFNEFDFQVKKELRLNNFRKFISTANDPNTLMINTDPNILFLNCLCIAPTTGNLIDQYVKLKHENPSLSTLAIGRMFLYSKKDEDFQTKLANTIIAVELYYNILDSKTK